MHNLFQVFLNEPFRDVIWSRFSSANNAFGLGLSDWTKHLLMFYIAIVLSYCLTLYTTDYTRCVNTKVIIFVIFGYKNTTAIFTTRDERCWVIRTYLRRIYCCETTHFLFVVVAVFLLVAIAREKKTRINQRFVKVCAFIVLSFILILISHRVRSRWMAKICKFNDTPSRQYSTIRTPIIDEKFRWTHTQQNWRYTAT